MNKSLRETAGHHMEKTKHPGKQTKSCKSKNFQKPSKNKFIFMKCVAKKVMVQKQLEICKNERKKRKIGRIFVFISTRIYWAVMSQEEEYAYSRYQNKWNKRLRINKGTK